MKMELSRPRRCLWIMALVAASLAPRLVTHSGQQILRGSRGTGARANVRAVASALQCGELLTESEVLERDGSVSAAHQSNGSKNQEKRG